MLPSCVSSFCSDVNNRRCSSLSIASLCGVVGFSMVKNNWRDVASLLLDHSGERYVINTSVLRSQFVDTPIMALQPAGEHSHGTAAANRSSGSFFIEQFAKNVGKEVVFFQGSESDHRNGRKTSRSYFWAKDLGAKASSFRPKGSDLVAMVDVCQYIDVPSFLVEYFRPLVLYTFQPSQVARNAGEYDFTFNECNEVIYHVNGGATYIHPVWNYDTDSICMFRMFAGKSWTNWKNWIPFVTTVYKIDKRQMDADHQVILFSPQARYFGLFGILARFLEASPLKRLKVVCGDFLRMQYKTLKGVMVSTARVGELCVGVTTAEIDQSLASIARGVKSGLTTAHVRKHLPEDVSMPVVYEFHARQNPTRCVLAYSGERTAGVRNYTFKPEEYDPDSKPSMVSFMCPLLDGGFCPDLSPANAEQAIQGRITNVKVQTEPTKFLMRCIHEFVDVFYESIRIKRGSLIPVEPEVVYYHQDRPTQRRILELAQFVDPTAEGKGFLKKEAYGKVSDPRIITTINENDKYHYSRFIYAFSEVLKRQSWYAFGKTPVEIAEGVVRITSSATHVMNTDFSRFDGSVSEVPRLLEKYMMLYGFPEIYHEKILELLRSQQNLCVFLSTGTGSIRYNSGLARASGSPETAAFNSILNAFTAFLANRMSRMQGRFMESKEAYLALGKYGGDDGITANVAPHTYLKAAKMMGFTLDVEVIKRGEAGVKFLSRVYSPDVWYGDLTSMCDLPRALSKFHMTSSMPLHITNFDKLLDKAYAYYLTDAYTPVIGEFVTKIVLRFCPDYNFENLNNGWFAQFDQSVQYPNSHNNCYGSAQTPEWMLGELVKSLPGFRYDVFIDWLDQSTHNLEYFLSPPVCHEPLEPKNKLPVVVDGEYVDPVVDSETKSPPKRGGKRTKTRRGVPRKSLSNCASKLREKK